MSTKSENARNFVVIQLLSHVTPTPELVKAWAVHLEVSEAEIKQHLFELSGVSDTALLAEVRDHLIR